MLAGRVLRARRSAMTAAIGVLVVSVPAALLDASPAVATSPTGPPPVTILHNPGTSGEGDFFITPAGSKSTYANGPEIINSQGQVVWFHPVPQGETATNFRVQTYEEQPVLTWWQGTGFGGLSSGTDYIYNQDYKQIATVNAGNGYHADGHEFLITPSDTALITVFTTAKANLTSMGGSSHQTVIDGIVQEIDIATGKVLFQWDSADHVPYSDSEVPLPSSPNTPWDWFHVNAVQLDDQGNFLIDARDTWTTYDVNSQTGAINWEIGGKQSSFTVKAGPGQTLDQAGEIFAWQHDPQQVGTDQFTWFDDEATKTSTELAYSRAVSVDLDFSTHVATLVASDNQPEGLSATSMGNVQTLSDGNLVVGWGHVPYFSEFSPSGQLLFNAEFPANVDSYRVFRFAWPESDSGLGRPAP
jgi:hypothetical protein